jgi:predicted ATPase/class 3 adenylate cyclase/tRNA A-37 threonylcarbamoyl transferase component Bud32
MIEVPGYRTVQTLYDSPLTSVRRAQGPDGVVVLKVLVAPYPTALQLEAYQREFDILSRLKSAGVPRVHALLEVGNGRALVLESIAAPTLRAALPGQPMRAKPFLDFARQLVRTLAEVHASGVIHKDVNPDNILYDPAGGTVHLIDFDIATELPLEHTELTEVLQLQGSLTYVSPEQTGRMHRSLDSRTDLYSLGATFYEALTGQPPFESDHPMGLLHGHIARVPRPLTELVPMPPVLSAIVLKLLAKDPVERYQSCAGLLHDLEECDRQLRETYTVVDFPLASRDYPTRFELPARLYGREEELRLLLDGFERVCTGQTEVLMIAGYSGIGKSSLVSAVHRPLVRERGRFIEGKFDLYRRDKPLSALIQACRALVVQILVEAETDLWKRELELALAGNLPVIAQEIPELAHIFGAMGPPPEVGAIEARNRLHFAFQRFVSTFARRQSPLVLFIDDLQWADQASLELIKAILTNPESQYLYFLGCYRENEVGADHVLVTTLAAIELVHPVRRVTLPPLQREHLRALTTDAFGASADESAQLADILLEKTGGNPFFVGEFLRALHQAGLFVRDHARGEWVWDATRIRQQGPTENVSELMSSRLGRLPDAAQDALAVAAFLGTECEEATLAALVGADVREIRHRLGPAIADGVLQRTSGMMRRVARYRFAHDRVQQAAYQLIPESDRPQLHLRIGRLQRDRQHGDDRGLRLFDIVDHMNAGRAELSSVEERQQLASLNLEAGQRANASAAFAPALLYFSIGMEVLGDRAWVDQPELARALWLERGESEFLNGNHAQSGRYLSEYIERARSALESMPAYAIRIASHNARGQFVDAIGIGIEALGRLGIELPREPADIARITSDELRLIRETLAHRPIESLIDLPPMRDATLIEAVRILVYLTSTAYIGYPQIYPLIVAKQINLSIEHGNSPHSAVAYSSYAVLNSPGGLGDLDTSYRFGELALAMLDRDATSENVTNINFVFGTFVNHWRNHIATSLQYLDTACVASLEMGDYEYVRYSATFEAFYQVLMWRDLVAAREACDRRRLMLQKVRLESASGAFMLARQLTLTISGQTDPDRLSGPDFEEDRAHEDWLRNNDFLSLSCLAISRLILANLYGRADAIELVEKAQPFLVANTGMFLLAEYHFAAVLAFTRAASADAARADALVERARSSLSLLEAWAAASPVNMEHRVLLSRAEIAALGRDAEVNTMAEVVRLFERAGAAARANGFLLHEGVSYERAADFCARVGLDRFANSFLDDAIYAFERVAARPKAELLRLRRGEPTREPTPTITMRGTFDIGTVHGFDLDSVLRAGHVIAGAIRMDALLAELMKILIETAGAQRGALIRVTPAGLCVAATRDAEQNEVQRADTPLEAMAWIAPGVVRYALRTMEPLILRDASREGPFQEDPSVRATSARSILCLPIVYQGKVENVLYLQNDLSSGVFTPQRSQSLSLLSGQIAVSLKNAELYEQLKDRVEERTQQLELRNRFIRQAFGRYVSDDVAAMILESPEGLTFSGERRLVTILMADLRGFTPLTDRLPPENIVSIVNNFLGEMTEIIFRYEGTINEFIGDAILAIFGAPQHLSDHAERAVACAVAMQSAMRHVNARNRKVGLPAVEMGISLHTGEVVVGNVGSQKRAKYGVVGRPVNVAARIESCTVGGQILASERTLALVSADVITEREFVIHPKGMAEPLKVFDVVGIGGVHDMRIPEPNVTVIPLSTPVPVQIDVIGGQANGAGFRAAAIVALSAMAATVQCEQVLEVFANLRLRLPATAGLDELDFFAKVLSANDDGTYNLRFTSVSPEAQEWCDSVVRSNENELLRTSPEPESP